MMRALAMLMLMTTIGCAHGVDVIDVVPTENGVPLVVDDGPPPDAEQAKAGVRSGRYRVLVYDDKVVCTRRGSQRWRSELNIDRWNADDEIGRRLIALDLASAQIAAIQRDDDVENAPLWLVLPIEAAGRAATVERGQRAAKKLQAVTTSPITLVLAPSTGPYLVRSTTPPRSGEGLPAVVVGPPSPHARDWLKRFAARAPPKLEGPPVRYEPLATESNNTAGIEYSSVVVISCCFDCEPDGLVWDGEVVDTIDAKGPGVAAAIAELPGIFERGCRLPED